MDDYCLSQPTRESISRVFCIYVIFTYITILGLTIIYFKISELLPFNDLDQISNVNNNNYSQIMSIFYIMKAFKVEIDK